MAAKCWLVIFLLTLISVNLSQQKQNSAFECGIKVESTGLAVNGTESKEGEWPWLVSLFKGHSKQFICGGTIVSEYHVLTAAHCVSNKRKGKVMKANELLVYLGKHSLSTIEENTEWFYPHEILIHPDWDSKSDRYDADLAMLIAEVPIPFSSKILPVCLWTELDDDDDIAGTVVGWGASEHTGLIGNEDVPRQVRVKRVPSLRCYEEFYLIASIASSRTFCAGGIATGAGPCTGDSGGGFFVEDNGVWYIQGIISASFIDSSKRCDVTKYSLYTKLNEFLSWINLRHKTYDVLLRCDYSFYFDKGNRTSHCTSLNLRVMQPSTSLVLDRKFASATKIRRFGIIKQITPFFPNGIGKIFQNLSEIAIVESQLRFIERGNFEDLQNLETLMIIKNLITNIPSDAFAFLTNLWGLKIIDNKLARLHRNMLVNNKKLARFEINDNQVEELPSDLFRFNSELTHFNCANNKIKFINGQVFANLVNLKALGLSHNPLQTISDRAFNGLQSLVMINLRNNRLKWLHVNTFSKNRNLEMVEIVETFLEELHPKTFRNNLKLNFVVLSNNNLGQLDDHSLENLFHMKQLTLAGNSISEIPPQLFFNLTSLVTLEIQGNGIKTLHKDLISRNPSLTAIDGGFNELEELHPDFFVNNLNMHNISFVNNKFKHIEDQLFRNQANLVSLNFSLNAIETIAVEAFYGLTRLESLRIRYNNLKVLHEDLFVKNRRLMSLDAGVNQIEYLPAGLFRNNIFLSDIVFDYNSIKKIDVIFNRIRPYKQLSFLENVCIDNGKFFENENFANLEDVIEDIKNHC